MKITIEVPDELFDHASGIAKLENRKVEEVVVELLNEESTQWERIRSRGERGSRDAFLAALDQVPDVEAAADDQVV